VSTASTWSPAVHQVEQLVPIHQIHTGLQICGPALEAKLELAPGLPGEGMAERVVHHGLQGRSELSRPALEGA